MLLTDDTAQSVLREPWHGLGKPDGNKYHHITKYLVESGDYVALCGYSTILRLKGWKPGKEKQYICDACWRVFSNRSGTPENAQKALRLEEKRMALTYNLDVPPEALELLPPAARQVLEREHISTMAVSYGVRYEMTPATYEKFLALAKGRQDTAEVLPCS